MKFDDLGIFWEDIIPEAPAFIPTPQLDAEHEYLEQLLHELGRAYVMAYKCAMQKALNNPEEAENKLSGAVIEIYNEHKVLSPVASWLRYQGKLKLRIIEITA